MTVESPGIPAVTTPTLYEARGRLIHLQDDADQGALRGYRQDDGVEYPHILLPHAYRLPTASKTSLPNAERRGPSPAPRGPAPAPGNRGPADSETLPQNLLPHSLLALLFPTPPGYASLIQSLGRDSPIRRIEWHPFKQVLAVAHRQDSVFCLDLVGREQFYPPQGLSHPRQRDVTCLSWRPILGNTLAVGGSLGVTLWQLSPPPSSLHAASSHPVPFQGYSSAMHGASTSEPFSMAPHAASTAWATILCHPGWEHVTSLTWFDSGKLLIVGCAEKSGILVWEVARTIPQVIQPSLLSLGPTSAVVASPSSTYLAQGTAKALVLYLGQNFNSKVVKTALPVQSIVWAQDSFVLYSLRGDPEGNIYGLRLTGKDLESIALKPWTVGLTQAQGPNGKPIRFGGAIQELAVDPSGTRLAVSFAPRKPRDPGNELIMYYSLKSHHLGSVALSFVGFIRGPSFHPLTPLDLQPPGSPLTLEDEFLSDAEKTQVVERGAQPLPKTLSWQRGVSGHKGCLCIGWENGKLGWLPASF